MPNYVFKNKTTNEIVEHSFSYKEYDQFLIDNPDTVFQAIILKIKNSILY